MGIIRHYTILTCFDYCGFKLAGTCIGASFLFLNLSKNIDLPYWPPIRLKVMGLACFLWGSYLSLYSFKFGPWVLDIIFTIVAALFWLERQNPAARILSPAIILSLLIRRYQNEPVIIFTYVALVGFIFWRCKESTRNKIPSKVSFETPKRIKLTRSVLRITGVTIMALILIKEVVGPINNVLDPQKRWEFLTHHSPSFENLNNRSLSPLGNQLKNHVLVLAETIGERAAYQPQAQLKARDYIGNQFIEMGFKPRYLEYQAKGMYYVKDGAPFYNVEVTLSSAENQDDGIIVVGAHYDTAPGTRGADDNASGVAVLIELARIFKINNQKREIRLVAFGTEEPPAFGTQNMGSFHYAQKLKNENIKVKGMISLEMLGYYNPKKGSQLYPPFLHLFFPNHGNFIALVSNFSSRSFLKSLSYKWDKNSFPLVTATLPTVFSGITLSDQLNFWDAGFPAVMLTDTSFFRNPHYHQETDTPEKLNYENMALITKTLADVLTNIK
jgi:hypothetical protein